MTDIQQAITNTIETIAICDEALADKDAYEADHIKMVRKVRKDAVARVANLTAMLAGSR